MNTRTVGRIKLPGNATEVLELAKKIYDKHVADGAVSPLNVMADYSWATDEPKVAIYSKDNADAEAFKKSAEDVYAEGILIWSKLKKMWRTALQCLKGFMQKIQKS